MVGGRTVAVIDPGPDVESHVRAHVSSVAPAEEVLILLTHGHADHAAAAPALAAETGATVYGPPGIDGVTHGLEEGDAVSTDEGGLVAVHTPGHTREHLAFHWADGDAVFVGDLLLGQGDTTWVAEYPGCVADYLDSLARVEALGASTLYPTHGPPLDSPREAIRRFEAHRRARIEEVRAARDAHPDADVDALVEVVYGDTVPSSMRGAARKSLEAVLHHLETGG